MMHMIHQNFPGLCWENPAFPPVVMTNSGRKHLNILVSLVKNKYYKEYKTFRAKVFQFFNHVDDYVDEFKHNSCIQKPKSDQYNLIPFLKFEIT